MLRDRRGRINVAIVVSGIIALAAICFGLYIWANMPESGIENPEVGDPLLYVGILIVAIVVIVMLIRVAK